MRTPSPAVEGRSETQCHLVIAMEPAATGDTTQQSTHGHGNEPVTTAAVNETPINTSNSIWEIDEQNAFSGVADFLLQLQQQNSPSAIPSPNDSLPDEEEEDTKGEVLVPIASNRKNGVTTALDIAALRKSLSGRPRLKRVCHICGRECPSRHKLQRHLSTHSEDRPYNCNICGKAFKWTEYLSKHMRTQHGAASAPAPKQPCMRHRSVNSPSESGSSTEPCSPKQTGSRVKCCHSTRQHRTSSSGVGTTDSNTIHDKTHKARRSTSISTASDSGTPSDALCSPKDQDNSNDSITNNQQQNNNRANSNSSMPQADAAFHFPAAFSSAQYPTPNGYYPGFYPMNPYHPYMNATPYNFPMSNQPFPNMMMQNYPYDPMMHAAGFMMDSSISTTTTTEMMNSSELFNSSSQNSKSSSVSCQTQVESQTSTGATNTSNKSPTKKKSSIKIINMTSKKDIGIQCEVGDETIRALYDEDGCYMECNSPGSNSNVTDDGELCTMCKYPCEEDSCNRAYVHRKDLTRRMKIAHGISPTIMEPRVIEAPVKPYNCNIGDCSKSYYHMKDLRRHQRHCHSSSSSNISQNYDIDIDNSTGSLRYPCDFSGCSKSYIHKKDLIRHKRMCHSDALNHFSVPNPVVMLQTAKKTKRSRKERSLSDDTTPLKELKRAHLDTSHESLLDSIHQNTSNSSPDTPLLSVDGLSSSSTAMSSTALMDSISTAVANMVSIEELSSQIFNISPSVISSALSKDTTDVSPTSATDMLLENLSMPSPSSDFTSNGFLNDTNLLSTN